MASKHRRTALLAGCGLAAVAGMTRTSSAATTLFTSNGFEPTGTLTSSTFNANGTVVTAGYIPNQVLAGQSALAANTFQFSATTGNTSSSAQPVIGISTYATTFNGNSNPSNSQLAIAVDTGINGSAGAVAQYYPNTNLGPLAYNTSIPSNGKVIDVVFTLSTPAATSGSPVFGVEAFTAGGSPVGELLVNSANSSSGLGTIVGSANTPTFAPTLGAGNFYSYELQLNYATQTTNLYEAAPGSAAFTNLIGSSPFLSGSTAAPLTTFSYAALTSFSLSGSTLASGDGLFDDYSVTAATSAVPEPTVASLAVGATALLASRRKRRVAGR